MYKLSIEYLTASYYDNYVFPNRQDFDAVNNISGYSDTEGSSTFYFEGLNNKVTGTKSKVIGTTATYLTSTNYYDDKYRIIQSRRSLYDLGSGIETVSNKYDFTEKLLQTKQSQTFGSTILGVDKFYTYDHANRLLKIEQKIADDAINGNNGMVTISELTYNELGQLTDKKLHGGLQSLDYRYNIWGWLTSVNNPDNLSNDGTGDINADLFAERLLYNTTETNLNTTVNFNGNISAIVWNSTGKSEQGYTFGYDAINRLTGSDYKTRASSWADGNNAYEEKNITYDRNGNITALLRTNNTGGNLNNFTYTYSNQSNQLLSITGGLTNYIYDRNGNSTTDGLRNFTVSYNLLNLPSTISKASDNISYIYAASGEKLAKKLKDNTYLYYAGNIIYKDDKTFNFLLFTEGRITKPSGGYQYEYSIKDHLGNTRVVFSPNGTSTTLLQVAEYYPFGSEYVPISPSNDNKFLYNGKELQDDILSNTAFNWYDYGARFYDPQIARWTTPDPLSEVNGKWSPYNYCKSNPIRFIDPNGALDDNYSVDNRGNIKFEEKTKDKFDVLYTKESWDKGTKDISITIDKAILDNKRRTMETYYDPWNSGETYKIANDKYVMSNDKKTTDLFEFLAKNTRVEWAVTRIGNKSGEEGLDVLTTSHISWTVHTSDYTDWLMDRGWNIRGEDHNHPWDKDFPLGNPNPSGIYGDKGYANKIFMKNPKAIFRIYTAGDGKYHSYTNK